MQFPMATVKKNALYIVRTLDERVDCSCLEKFTSFSACTPLSGYTTDDL
jgi:hypothetical protein